MDDHQAWLAAAVIDIADGQDLHESDYLVILTQRLAEIVGPSEIGLLVTTDTGSLTTSAASSTRMQDLMTVESRYTEGPCATCHGTGQPVQHQTLAAVDSHWPRYGPAARRAGFTDVSAYPLRHRTEMLGAVSLLDPIHRPDDKQDIERVAIVILAAAIGLSHQRAYQHSQRRVEQLQQALNRRIVIEQATGIVSAQHNATLDDALEILRSRARRDGHRLSTVAEQVVAGQYIDQPLTPDT